MKRSKVETYDIVLVRKEEAGSRLIKHNENFNPGCQGISYEDIPYARDIFDRIARHSDREVKIIRKIHIWCDSCGAYVGLVKLPFIQIAFRPGICSETANIPIESEMVRCDACHHHTRFTIEPEIHTVY